MKQVSNSLFYIFLLIAATCQGAGVINPNGRDTSKISGLTAVKPDVSLTLPARFTATVFAEGLGKARHISITPSGYVYVKLASSKNGKTIVRLKDKNGDGVSDEETDFGSFKGTGIKVKNGYLYASSDVDVYRFKLNSDGTVLNADQPEKIVSGLISRGEHEAKAF